MLMRRGGVCSRSFNFPARSRAMPPRSRCNYLLLTTARSIAIWHCCVNGSIRLHLGFPMDACSLSPSVLPVAFFLRRSITKYRDSLMMRVVVAILWRVPSKDHRRPARAADLHLPTETWVLPEQDYRFCTRMSPLSVISMILAWGALPTA